MARVQVGARKAMFFLTAVVQFWNKWGFQISVLASLAANLLLSLLSGTRRRRSPYGWRSLLQWVAAGILWVAYQVADVATTSAVGNLSLSGPDATTDEQQLVAFWAPFLLLHLGGPDNMTAYSLEDNKLSARTLFDMVLYIVGVSYAVYNYLYHGGHSWLLFAASAIMLVVGAARYVEKVIALWGANLDNMQEAEDSTKKTDEREQARRARSTESSVESRISRSRRGELGGDGEALLLAQDLFPVWRRALVDSSVKREPSNSNQRASEMIFSLGWESMCAVVEMELSLMYELLYTKAAVAHTWPGYLIRFASPLAAGVAASLFWLWLHDGRRRITASFLTTTYILLGAAMALDVVWLLRALGSTWTYAFLKTLPPRAPAACLHHQLLCAGRWHRFHRTIVDLDPLRRLLLGGCDAISCGHRDRRWPGTIGRYNLLRECAATTPPRVSSSCWRWLATKTGVEEARYLSELPEGVKGLTVERVLQILPLAAADDSSSSGSTPPQSSQYYSMTEITTLWGRKTLDKHMRLFRGREVPKFGKEFEEDVMAWHIATCIFLSRDNVKTVAEWSSSSPELKLVAKVAAMEAMSEYLMFLVAQRRDMLPGLVLHSLLQETRWALEYVWNGGDGREATTDPTTTPLALQGKERLATFVREMRINKPDWAESNRGWLLVSDAAGIASALSKSSGEDMLHQLPEMMDFVFKVWVDKLLYAAVRCSREHHAQQLSRGGELTTLLWIIVHHAGPFRIGEERLHRRDEKKQKEEEEEKKKKEEEKKPAPETPVPMWQPPVWDERWRPPYWEKPEPKPKEDEKPKAPPKASKEEEEAKKPKLPIPKDPLDAAEYKTPIKYVTL
ncbi:hypothetical protein U9M48_041001 [Paspalum notatum var. saurae]|uniref:DUF4220 domain-containing protein n=1 Tax=Paspalum notatum var. saurae TaxID=547442 RepID=A0AAQ3US95_PASNO